MLGWPQRNWKSTPGTAKNQKSTGKKVENIPGTSRPNQIKSPLRVPECVWSQLPVWFPPPDLMSVGQPPLWWVCQQGAADAAGGLCCSHSAFPAPTPERDEHASPLHPVLQLPCDRQQGRRCYNLLIFLSHVHILHIYDLITSTLFWYSRRGFEYIRTPFQKLIFISEQETELELEGLLPVDELRGFWVQTDVKALL